jgi:hypothetical protein
MPRTKLRKSFLRCGTAGTGPFSSPHLVPSCMFPHTYSHEDTSYEHRYPVHSIHSNGSHASQSFVCRTRKSELFAWPSADDIGTHRGRFKAVKMDNALPKCAYHLTTSLGWISYEYRVHFGNLSPCMTVSPLRAASAYPHRPRDRRINFDCANPQP